MSYAYQSRKKAIKRAKREHADKVEHGQLPADLMPKNPNPPKFLGTLADFEKTI